MASSPKQYSKGSDGHTRNQRRVSTTKTTTNSSRTIVTKLATAKRPTSGDGSQPMVDRCGREGESVLEAYHDNGQELGGGLAGKWGAELGEVTRAPVVWAPPEKNNHANSTTTITVNNMNTNNSARHHRQMIRSTTLDLHANEWQQQQQQLLQIRPQYHNQRPTESQSDRQPTTKLYNRQQTAPQWSHLHRQLQQDPDQHKYDYYTTNGNGEIASQASAVGADEPQADQLLLRFAIEHNQSAVRHQQLAQNEHPNTNINNNNNIITQPHQSQPQAASSADQQHYFSGQQRPARHQYHSYTSPMGRFVEGYPAWRLLSSPTTWPSNYGFHVPSPSRPSSISPAPTKLVVRGHQSRFGYMYPADKSRSLSSPARWRPGASGGSLGTHSRSKTYSHLPNLVKVSVDYPCAPPAQQQEGGGGVAKTYEDFYEKPSTISWSTAGVGDGGPRQVSSTSEGNLLKAHRICVRHPDAMGGYDNPFRPGTELSWEADMMVKLIQRGYPVGELPSLVQSAKQMAQQQTERPPDEECRQGTEEGYAKPERQRQLDEQGASRPRLGSIGELDSVKKVWVSSLSRAKSSPRISRTTQDTDSIDKLITSIETEMASLLREQSHAQQERAVVGVKLSPQQKKEQRNTKRKTSGDFPGVQLVDGEKALMNGDHDELVALTDGGSGAKVRVNTMTTSRSTGELSHRQIPMRKTTKRRLCCALQ